MGKTPGMAWGGLLLAVAALSGCECCSPWGGKSAKNDTGPTTLPRVASNTQPAGTAWSNQPRGYTLGPVDPNKGVGTPVGTPSTLLDGTSGTRTTSTWPAASNPATATGTPGSANAGLGASSSTAATTGFGGSPPGSANSGFAGTPPASGNTYTPNTDLSRGTTQGSRSWSDSGTVTRQTAPQAPPTGYDTGRSQGSGLTPVGGTSSSTGSALPAPNFGLGDATPARVPPPVAGSSSNYETRSSGVPAPVQVLRPGQNPGE